MKIAIGADHAGFQLKERVRKILAEKGHEVADFGTHSGDSTDYPDYAALVARAVQSGEAQRGVLICATGVGMSIAANKLAGIRAALAVNPDEVRLTRSHNDANILTLGATFTQEAQVETLVDVFLNTEFDGGRHSRRLAKIEALERDGLSREATRKGSE